MGDFNRSQPRFPAPAGLTAMQIRLPATATSSGQPRFPAPAGLTARQIRLPATATSSGQPRFPAPAASVGQPARLITPGPIGFQLRPTPQVTKIFFL